MALGDDVITLPRLRQAIGGVSDNDATMGAYRDAAIAWISEYTGRCILDKAGTQQSSPQAFGYSPWPDRIWFRVSDIKQWGDTNPLTLHFSQSEDDPSGRPSQSEAVVYNDEARRVVLDYHALTIYGDPDDPWIDKMRMMHPIPYITYSLRGMASADIPATWGQAVALIVRALYDGTAYDSIGNDSALDLMMRPWCTGGSGPASVD